MQAEVRAARPDYSAEILGVNDTHQSAYNDSVFAENRRLPWLQDVAAVSVWTAWGVVYRDVWVVDALNRRVAVYNLSALDLGREANYQALKGLILNAARAADTDADGLPDDWETQHFDGLAQGRGDDPDGDGFDNGSEFAYATDPVRATSLPQWSFDWETIGESSRLKLTLTRWAGGFLDFTFSTGSRLGEWGIPGTRWQELEQARNLADGSGGTRVVYALTAAPSELPSGFVRLLVQRRGRNP